ncbi:MAG TPA: DHH family phosphoesterase [Candidatus Nanoarchaeia archaeon]|nr:DHH family phosphoesterase [Candidatus Nanoarchaeia archaeon]
MLSSSQIKLLQDELRSAKNPLFLYDADADGLASFLLLYRIHREGKGIRITAGSKIGLDLARKVQELNPDKIFILDIPLLDQEFVNQVKRPIFWIDHHEPQKINNVHYFNPRIKDPDAYVPTTRMAYQVSQNQDDLWIATAGCLADWHMPDFIEEFMAQYPELLNEKSDLATTLYQHPVGKLVKLFFFLQKGQTSDVRKSIQVLSKIKSPREIFGQENAPGKFLYKRFEKINQKYEEVLTPAKEKVSKSKIVLFTYTSAQWSFTTNIANELAATYPKKVIIIARKKSGEMKASIRAQFRIVDALERALVGVSGYGGGHPNACGAVIKEEDWDRFVDRFKEELKHEHAD